MRDGSAQSPDALSETRVSDRVFAWTLGGETMATSWGANCAGVVGDEGALLVDPLIAPAHARLVEAALSRHTDLPVTHVVLTHHHTDHALGSSWFARRGVRVLAHRACAERMEAEHPALVASRRAQPDTARLFEDAEPCRPDRVYDEEEKLDLGGLAVRVAHPGHGHTPGDSIVHVASESVAVCGDLVSSGYHVNMEDASTEGVLSGLDALACLDAQLYVPGHGAVGGSELIDEQRSYHLAISAAVRDAAAAGLPSEEILTRLADLFPSHRLRLVLPSAVPAWS
jgi:cyclase